MAVPQPISGTCPHTSLGLSWLVPAAWPAEEGRHLKNTGILLDRNRADNPLCASLPFCYLIMWTLPMDPLTSLGVAAHLGRIIKCACIDFWSQGSFQTCFMCQTPRQLTGKHPDKRENLATSEEKGRSKETALSPWSLTGPTINAKTAGSLSGQSQVLPRGPSKL